MMTGRLSCRRLSTSSRPEPYSWIHWLSRVSPKEKRALAPALDIATFSAASSCYSGDSVGCVVFANIERSVAQGAWFFRGEDRWIEPVAFNSSFPAAAEMGPLRTMFQVDAVEAMGSDLSV
jgi:hypothetical protein